jgi:hypothetical protein
MCAVAAAMVGFEFSTNKVSKREAFAYWHDLVCANFIRLNCWSPKQSSFSGRFYLQSFADLQISAMTADEMHVERTLRDTRRLDEDYFIIPVQASSRTIGRQDSREFCLTSGDFAVFDSTRPYRASLLSTFRHFLLKVPRRRLKERLGSIESLTAICISGDRGMGRITSRFLQALPESLDQVDSVSGKLAETTLDLVSAAISDRLGAHAAESSTRTAHRMRAMSFVEANLARKDLSVTTVAESLRLSPRYVAALAMCRTLAARFDHALGFRPANTAPRETSYLKADRRTFHSAEQRRWRGTSCSKMDLSRQPRKAEQ